MAGTASTQPPIQWVLECSRKSSELFSLIRWTTACSAPQHERTSLVIKSSFIMLVQHCCRNRTIFRIYTKAPPELGAEGWWEDRGRHILESGWGKAFGPTNLAAANERRISLIILENVNPTSDRDEITCTWDGGDVHEAIRLLPVIYQRCSPTYL